MNINEKVEYNGEEVTIIDVADGERQVEFEDGGTEWIDVDKLESLSDKRNKRVLEVLEERGMEVVSDFNGTFQPMTNWNKDIILVTDENTGELRIYKKIDVEDL